MQVINQILITMLREHRELCLAGQGARPLPEKSDDLAFAVLLLAAEHEGHWQSKATLVKSIQESLAAIAYKGDNASITSDASTSPPSWILADQFALMLAEALIGGEQTAKGTPIPFYLLSNPQSGVRRFCFYSIWLFRKHARPYVLDYLLKNVADTLGYVEHSLGLARALFSSDEEFFMHADAFEPESYAEQYQSRIAQMKAAPSKLASYVELFVPLECRIRKLICEYALPIELVMENPKTRQTSLFN